MESPMIYKTINEVMKKISAVGKDRKNTMQNFQYRGIDDVMNELHPAMAECGLFVVPEVLSEERTTGQTKNGGVMYFTRQKIKFTFYAVDGSNLSAVVIGEAMDSGDKASNKALSIGLKYALLQVLCIPTEDEKDPDAQNNEMAAPAPRAQNKSAPAPREKQLKGGNDTQEQYKEIVELLKATKKNGEPIFAPDFWKVVEGMRTEKTADEVIAELKKRIAQARTEEPKADKEQTALF